MENFWGKDLNVQSPDIEKEGVQFNKCWPQYAARREVEEAQKEKLGDNQLPPGLC